MPVRAKAQRRRVWVSAVQMPGPRHAAAGRCCCRLSGRVASVSPSSGGHRRSGTPPHYPHHARSAAQTEHAHHSTVADPAFRDPPSQPPNRSSVATVTGIRGASLPVRLHPEALKRRDASSSAWSVEGPFPSVSSATTAPRVRMRSTSSASGNRPTTFAAGGRRRVQEGSRKRRFPDRTD